MEQSVFEHAGQQIDDTTHKATRAASAVADALEDSVIAARRVARDGSRRRNGASLQRKEALRTTPV